MKEFNLQDWLADPSQKVVDKIGIHYEVKLDKDYRIILMAKPYSNWVHYTSDMSLFFPDPDYSVSMISIPEQEYLELKEKAEKYDKLKELIQ